MQGEDRTAPGAPGDASTGAPSRSPGDRLAADAIADFPFDGSLVNRVDPRPYVPAGFPQPVTFSPRWDGRQAVHLPQGDDLALMPFSVPFGTAPPWPGYTVAASICLPGGASPGPLGLFWDVDSISLTVQQDSAGGVQLRVAYWTGESEAFAWPGPAVAGHWCHVACTIDLASRTITAYVDGVRIGSFAVTGSAPITPFHQPYVVTGAEALVADLHVFGRALTPEEVMYLACDLHHPEGTLSSTIEYLACTTGGQPIACPDDPSLNPAANPKGLTVTAWVSADELDLAGGVPRSILSRSRSYELGVDADGCPYGLVWPKGAASPTVLQAPDPLGATSWSFLGLSLGAQVQLTVDGEVVAAAADVGVADVAQATVTLAQGWPTAIYGIGVYGTALEGPALLVRMAETEGAEADELVYYDFSVNPALARSPVAALARPIDLPEGSGSVQVARGVALGLDARIDCGPAPDTTIVAASEAPLLTLSAWVRQLASGGYQTIAGRMSDEGGYVLAIRDGVPEASIVDGAGRSVVARSPVPLPLAQSCQVGALFVLSTESPSCYAIVLFVNGRVVAEAQLDIDSPADSIGALGASFVIGALEAPAALAAQSFCGLVERVTLHAETIDPYDLYYGTTAVPPVGSWELDLDIPSDTRGTHPATLVNGAWPQSYRAAALQPTPPSSPQQKQLRHAAWRGTAAADVVVPAEHQDLLATDPSQAGRLTVHSRDGVHYVVAHGLGGESACIFAAADVDPAVLQWVTLGVAVVGAFGMALYGLEIDPKAAFDVVKVGWETSTAIQAAIYGLSGTAGDVPALAYALLAALYEAGLLGRVLRCFALSYFSVLRIAASFAPYVGPAVMIGSLVYATAQIVEAVKTHEPESPPPRVLATPSSPSLTLNGDPIRIEVSLDRPPPAGVATVAAGLPPLLEAVGPSVLTFTAATFARPQAIEVQARAATNEGPDSQSVHVELRAEGALPSLGCDLDLRVAGLACDPDPVDLELDDDEQSYTGSFTVSLTAPIRTGSPVDVTFEIDGKPAEQTDYELTPSTLTLGDETQLSGPVRRVSVRLAAQKRTADKASLVIKATARTPGSAADGRRYVTRLSTRVAEEIRLTMVDAGKGNCFVIENTSRATKPPTVETAVIDGGVSRTDIASHLGPAGPVDVYCTHYDADHIDGLLTFVPAVQAMGRLRSVVFNPPPTGTDERLRAMADAGADVHPPTLQGINAGKVLEGLAGTSLRVVKDSAAPPAPGHERPGIGLPSLDVRWAGPSTEVWRLLEENVRSGRIGPVPVNRASLLFRMDSTLSSFGFLQTGDGYDLLAWPDIRGPLPGPQPVLDVLQVPHHGSRGNSDRLFYRAFPARNYLISTDYTTHRHPHVEMLEHLVAGRPPSAGPFTIYINTPNLPADFRFPTGPYRAFVRAPTAGAIRFRYAQGQLAVEAGDVEQRWPRPPALPLASRGPRATPYFVNRTPQANGDHEVHASGCPHLPASGNRVLLGSFTACGPAVAEAAKTFPRADGCAHCAGPCHTR